MSNNANKLDKIEFPWQSDGADDNTLAVPVVGNMPIVKGSTPPNPNPRVVYCLGCNTAIYPQFMCYGTRYKGQWRYICRKCFVSHGFEW